MATEFTPFFSAVRSRSPNSGGNSAKDSSQFAPLLQAAGQPLTDNSSSPASTQHAHASVSLEIKRDGDRISQIRVQCRCGELIDIECEY